MEIDKKIIVKLIQSLEELKKSLKNKINSDDIDSQQNVSIEEVLDKFKTVKSPIVGTAYLAPEPGAKKFIELGKKIKKGDTVMIIEAMKTMNHIPSSEDGTVKKICVEDGQPVEFDQQLVILE